MGTLFIVDESDPVFVRRNGFYMLIPFCELEVGDYLCRLKSVVGVEAHLSGDASYDGWLLYDANNNDVYPQDVCLFNPDEVERFARDLWNDLRSVSMNPETECMEEAWLHFPAGTHREEIWHWFESTFSVSVHDLMYGNRKG